jgi:hypothetical protein
LFFFSHTILRTQIFDSKEYHLNSKFLPNILIINEVLEKNDKLKDIKNNNIDKGANIQESFWFFSKYRVTQTRY